MPRFLDPTLCTDEFNAYQLASLAADLIRSMGVENVVFWAIQAPQAPHAAQFSRAFFASLRDPSAPTLEVCSAPKHRVHIPAG